MIDIEHLIFQTMKKVLLCCAALLGLTTTVFPQVEVKPVILTVTNAKGKPMDKSLISLKTSPLYREVDEQGSVTFRPMPNDTIFVTLGNYMGAIAFSGQETIDVCFEKNGFSDKKNAKTQYPTTKLPSFNSSKIYTNPGIESYGTISMLIKSKFPGIVIKKVRGYQYAFLNAGNLSSNKLSLTSNTNDAVVTINPADIGAADIIVDGKVYGALEEIDRSFKLARLVSITYEKPDPMFGKGGNGKVIITTLDGK